MLSNLKLFLNNVGARGFLKFLGNLKVPTQSKITGIWSILLSKHFFNGRMVYYPTSVSQTRIIKILFH